MKAYQLKAMILVVGISFPLVSQASPAQELKCFFQGQERHFKLTENPNEAVAYAMFEESDGICGLATARTDEQGNRNLGLQMYDSCYDNKVAELNYLDLRSPGFNSLVYVRPQDKKIFHMVCTVRF